VASQTPDAEGFSDDARAVRGLLGAHGLAGIIDIHTHFMPERVLTKVWAYFDGIESIVGRSWPVQYRFDEETRVQTLRDFGVTAFTSMIYPHKADVAVWLNDWAADFAARTPDCVHTATFYPEPTAPTYVASAIDGGARIFKAHLQVGDYDPNDPLLEPVWSMLEDAGIPIVIHAGSGPQPGRHTGPGPMVALMRRNPRLVAIIAHMGLPEYSEFLDLAGRYPNVHLDTTMAFTDYMEENHPYPAADRHRLVDLADRILFGSDYPNIPYPYSDAIAALVDLDLGDDWLRGVLHDNSRALLAA